MTGSRRLLGWLDARSAVQVAGGGFALLLVAAAIVHWGSSINWVGYVLVGVSVGAMILCCARRRDTDGGTLSWLIVGPQMIVGPIGGILGLQAGWRFGLFVVAAALSLAMARAFDRKHAPGRAVSG